MSPTPTRAILRYDDGGWAEATGGHPALDLVNTVSWRLDPSRTVDRLPDGAALERWADFVGLSIGAGDEVVDKVRRLREQIYRVVQPMAVGEEPEVTDVEALRRTLLGALGRAEVASVMPLELAAADLPDELALAAWRLLEREDAGRLRQCQASDCGWLFLDHTKNRSRVWCSSADCGNRSRARRHYARRTAEQQ
ncbi:MAG TPA: CGNR zinc finger domain-containing protein [Nocardioides sp.]|nr:CGNR zinc finger domain-containing protein [Nocardioides sp.]